MREGAFQTLVRKELEKRFPGCIVNKQDSSYRQGFPDLVVLMDYGFYAVLEIKKSADAERQPNQEFYVDRTNQMSFGALVHPGNLEEVLDAIQQAYESHRNALISKSQ